MSARVKNAGATASDGTSGGATEVYAWSSSFDRFEAMNAPPPKPMMARPVARPGRSGNHLMSVDTGEM